MKKVKASLSQWSLGCIIDLALSSRLHRKWYFYDFEIYFIPPLKCNQVYIYLNKDDRPVGLVTWARLDLERENGLSSRRPELQPHEWQTGERVWVIDFIAPFRHTPKIINHLEIEVFPNDEVRGLRRLPGGKIRKIGLWKGKNLRTCSRPTE